MRAGIYLWRDQTYIGQEAVAAAAGVAPQTVSNHLRVHGNLDRLGMGRGRHGNHAAPAAKPLTVGPCDYPSIAAFARAVGVKPKCVHRWVREGRADCLMAAQMAADARRAADMTDRIGRAAA